MLEYMYRKTEGELFNWLQGKNRKPLILRGARQVGKSTLVRQFCSNQKLNLVEINLEKNKIDSVFETLDISRIILEIEAISKKKLSNPRTVLFLDEIQEAPHAIMALRYFYEERPDLPVIAAGSLLEFVLNSHNFSMPVGRIQYLYLGPMSFSEYLIARGEESLVKYLTTTEAKDEIPESAHNQLNRHVREFLYVGGMPEAVKIFSETKDIHAVRDVHRSIIDTYCSDFEKYSKKNEKLRIEKVWRWVPLGLGEKVKYVNIAREEQSRDVIRAISLLINARVLLPVYHSNCNGIPLRAGIDDSAYKLYFLDIGLISTMQDLSFSSLTNMDELNLLNKGKLIEQFVAQHLYYKEKGISNPELFYWLRDKQGSSAEVDFVFSKEGNIYPVEVKAGKIGRMKSMEIFVQEKNINHAIRFNFDKKSVFKKENSTILSLPVYLVESV